MRLFLDGAYHAKVDYAVRQLSTAVGESFQRAGRDEADVVAGATGRSPVIDRLVEQGRLYVPGRPESLALRRDAHQLIVAGRDDQGLMYALLELTDQVSLEGLHPTAARETIDEPATELRGIFTFLHNADCEREWFPSAEHWRDYFDLLARSRYNSFQLVLAHQTSYLAPPFPFFIDVPEHPEVTVPSLTDDERRRNRDALRMIADLAAEHGLEFVVGIWEVLPWTPGARGGHRQPSMVEGLGHHNLVPYTYLATRRLLEEVPGIKGLQLRVNPESGIPEEGQTEFFTATVFEALRTCGRPVLLDLRGWGASAETITAAEALGLPMRLSMKFWAEHLGPPYQAAEQDPAYSYADFLRHPRHAPVSYQVWALGSHRHFVWGNPDYVRTFARSLGFGDAVGFEISPPLAQKGFGNEPGAWRVLAPEHEYYRWEWERYWLFYLLFGRLTYDPGASQVSWQRHLTSRFGPLAHDVLEAYRAGSEVLSFLILVAMSDPNMYIWPEADTGGLLDHYSSVTPSDTAFVKSFRESAAERMTGSSTARLGPTDASDHLRQIGEQCRHVVDRLRTRATGQDIPRRDELMSTIVDVQALGELALYHAQKIRAAEQVAIYEASGELGALLEAAQLLADARPHWERLSAVTDGVYTDRQVTGPVDSGHWRDKLVLVADDAHRLNERIALHVELGGGIVGGAIAAFDFGARSTPDYSYTRWPVAQDTVERGFVGVDGDHRWEHPGSTPFGWRCGTVRTVAAGLARLHDRHTDTVFRDTMARPGYEHLVSLGNLLYRDYVGGADEAEFVAVVTAGQHEVTVIVGDQTASPVEHGPFTVSVNGRVLASGMTTAPGELVRLRGTFDLTRTVLRVRFEPDPGADWCCSAIVVRDHAPVIRHVPIWSATEDRPTSIRATALCPAGIDDVRLHLAGEDGRGVRTLVMNTADGQVFDAAVPEDLAAAGGRLGYWFEATGRNGRTGRLPSAADPRGVFDLVVSAGSGRRPIVTHRPIERAEPGAPVDISVDVTSDRVLRRVTLHYRYTCQFFAWQHVDMAPCGEGSYAAQIPGDIVVPDWDLMYYVEVIDDGGVGCMAPCLPGFGDIPYWVITVAR